MTTSNPIVPGTEIDGRISRLQKLLQADDMGGAVIIQKADLFYYTGTYSHPGRVAVCAG